MVLPNTESGKHCRVCKEWKSFGLFYRRKDSPDGYRTECRACLDARAKAYATHNRDAIRKYKREWMRRKYTTSEDLRQYRHEYNLAYYRRTRSERLAHARKYNKRPDIAARRRAYNASPERRERDRHNRQVWRRNNRDRYLLNKHRRRAAEKAGGGSYTEAQWRELVTLCGGQCLACGRIERLTVDHIVPVSKGGGNSIDNLQPLCFWCNSGKCNRNDADYRPEAIKQWAMNQLSS